MGDTAVDDYWQEAVGEALESAGLQATGEQIAAIAGDMCACHENYGTIFGLDVASQNWRASQDREKAELLKRLNEERDKVTCRVCRGTGGTHTYGGTLMSTSQCWKCRGDGRHLP